MCLISGQAHSAVLQEAEVISGGDTLDACYRRTGDAWQAKRAGDGSVRWHRLAALAAI
jgi:hypothetical protein